MKVGARDADARSISKLSQNERVHGCPGGSNGNRYIAVYLLKRSAADVGGSRLRALTQRKSLVRIQYRPPRDVRVGEV